MCRTLRGNVETRLRKLSEEGFHATILAAAGLRRLGMEEIAGYYFSIEEMLPAAGQGILAVQGRKGEKYLWINEVDHVMTRAAALAERQFVTELEGGCTSPASAYARVQENEIELTGLYYRESDGAYFRGQLKGALGDAQKTGSSWPGRCAQGMEARRDVPRGAGKTERVEKRTNINIPKIW
ncbi:hypothetical protein ABXS75_15250 [Roseburia hominis]